MFIPMRYIKPLDRQPTAHPLSALRGQAQHGETEVDDPQSAIFQALLDISFARPRLPSFAIIISELMLVVWKP